MSKHHARLDARRWAQTRRAVFQRDGWRCKSCGRRGRLECDHVVPLDLDRDQDPYAVDGCQTQCRSCHILKTRRENVQKNPERAAWAEYESNPIPT